MPATADMHCCPASFHGGPAAAWVGVIRALEAIESGPLCHLHGKEHSALYEKVSAAWSALYQAQLALEEAILAKEMA